MLLRTTEVTHRSWNTAAGKIFRQSLRIGTMVRAFIMVKAGSGHAESLLGTVRGLRHVADANVVAGDFDVIVEAEAEEVYDVINGVATKVRELDNVDDTKTYVCLE